MDLSILIVSWNTREVTLACLRSLAACAIAVSHEIILVDNASQDGSLAAIAGEFPAVKLIDNAQNLGFATANNQAYQVSCGRLVLLLNSDTLVTPGQLEAMVAAMDADSRVGMLGPRLLNPDGSDQLSALRFIQPWDLFYEYARFPAMLRPRAQAEPRRLIALDPVNPTPVDYVVGAALLVRRDVVARIGLMDDTFFMYGEEVDWCYRAKAAGWEVTFLPTAVVTHLGGQSTALVPWRMLACRFASSFKFLGKHQGPGAVRLTRALLVWAAAQNVAMALLFRLVGREDGPTMRHHLGMSWVVSRTALLGVVPGNLG